MSDQTDEAAAQDARRAGDRFRMAPLPTLVVIEPAKPGQSGGERVWWHVQPLELMFVTFRPKCNTCGFAVNWLGPPRKKMGFWIYPVECECGQDAIISGYPLRMICSGTFHTVTWG